jgi:tetratricopeptide (TPR) repeat protein
VHHAAKAAVVSAGGLLISDLVLAAPNADSLQPVVDLEAGAAGLVALVELAGRGAGGASVALELADRADGPPLLSVPIEASAVDRDGSRVARARVAGGLLPPGEYVARASIAADGRAVAAVTRPFRVAAPRAGAAGPEAVATQAASRTPLAALLTEQRPYDRAELLAPETLGYFLDRMAELGPGPLPRGAAAAVEEARAGRAAAMGERLPSSGTNDARIAFLRGVSFYAANDLNAALAQLQAALRARSDFFAAAVYMGACYAAGGKDQDAIGAWQTSLIGETGSSAVYAVLSDALLRVGEADQAVAILDEGLAAFPLDAGLRRRLAMAHAMAGKPDALNLLTAWVDAHPEDTRALFTTLALLFDGFSREAAGGASAEEQQRLRRYARAYVDANGPNKEVVDRWLRYLESRGGS